MEIREIDPHDEALTRRFWEVGRAADERGRPWSTYWSWPAARAAFTTPASHGRKVLLAAFGEPPRRAGRRPADAMVGTAEISLPLLDNPHLAYVEIFVDPERQRCGVGTALLEAGARAAGGQGRRTLSAEVSTPLQGSESAGLRFARRHGFGIGVVEETKVVDLPATEHLWDQLLRETEDRAPGYELNTWRDVCPERYLEGYCALIESFNAESPTGTLDVEPERWDRTRVREKEARFRKAGRHETTTVAVAPDGRVVGVTEVMVGEDAPHRGFQGATLVAPGHRGRSLGVRMKALNHTAVRRRFPDCTHLLTGNADVNAHMNAVNDRLGYEAVERVVEMQKEIS